MVRYFTSVGAPALPLHTNPATYMLEVLHLQRKAAAAAVDVPEAAAKTPSLLGDVSDAASVDATSPSTSVDGLTGAATPISASAGGADGDGEEMSPKQWAAVFAQSPAGAAERKELLTLLEPGTLVAVPATALSHADYEAYKAQHAGAHEHSLEHLHTLMVPMQPLAFSSAYARSWPVQALVVLQRALLDSWRNTDYNGSRLVAITFLGLFFGLIYIDVDFTSFAGVQSALGAVLASCGFPGVIGEHASICCACPKKSAGCERFSLTSSCDDTPSHSPIPCSLHHISAAVYPLPRVHLPRARRPFLRDQCANPGAAGD